MRSAHPGLLRSRRLWVVTNRHFFFLQCGAFTGATGPRRHRGCARVPPSPRARLEPQRAAPFCSSGFSQRCFPRWASCCCHLLAAAMPRGRLRAGSAAQGASDQPSGRAAWERGRDGDAFSLRPCVFFFPSGVGRRVRNGTIR